MGAAIVSKNVMSVERKAVAARGAAEVLQEGMLAAIGAEFYGFAEEGWLPWAPSLWPKMYAGR